MQRNRFVKIAIIGLLAVPFAVGQEAKKDTPKKAPAAAAPKPAATPTPAPTPSGPPRENGLYATLVTTMGPITFKLFENESPITVKNFVDLSYGRKQWKDPRTNQTAAKPLYNGVIFHRVIPGFMVQVGDPTGTGSGDIGYTIPDEFAPSLQFDQPGRVGMANAGPRTGSSQFFITEVPTPHLNGKHTIFGQVVEGQDLVNQIARVPRDSMDKPRTPVRITKVVITRFGPVPPNAPEVRPTPKPAAPVKKAPVAPTKAATPVKK